jgi:hypothetical protein
MEGRQDMGIGQDMGDGWRRGRARRGRRGSGRMRCGRHGSGKSGRQSRIRQEVEKREISIRGGKRGGRRPQQFPIVTLPALAIVDTPNASQFKPCRPYFSNLLL